MHDGSVNFKLYRVAKMHRLRPHEGTERIDDVYAILLKRLGPSVSFFRGLLVTRLRRRGQKPPS